MIMTFENQNPTETEALLYRYYGFYLIEKSEDSYRYAPIHADNDNKEIPLEINIEKEMVEWENAILFDCMSETVTISPCYYDIDFFVLIVRRMEELGFKRTFTLQDKEN